MRYRASRANEAGGALLVRKCHAREARS